MYNKQSPNVADTACKTCKKTEKHQVSHRSMCGSTIAPTVLLVKNKYTTVASPATHDYIVTLYSQSHQTLQPVLNFYTFGFLMLLCVLDFAQLGCSTVWGTITIDTL